jgi:hypothetical protein
LAGMTYLHALLARPGYAFPARDLYEIENPPHPESLPRNNPEGAQIATEYGTGGKQAPVMDLEMRKAIIARKAEVEEELKETELDVQAKEDREEEIERLKKALASRPATEGNVGATFEAPETKVDRQAVCRAIERAVASLAEQTHGGGIAKHLGNVKDGGNIHMGSTLLYNGGMNWET